MSKKEFKVKGKGNKKLGSDVKDKGINGMRDSRVDIMEILREIFSPELDWLDSKGAPLDKTIGNNEKELWFNGEWTERYGVVAGGLYLEEEVGGNGLSQSSYRPIRGVLVGIRGQGRKRKRGRPVRYSKPVTKRRLGKLSPIRKIIKLDSKLAEMYRLEEDYKRRIEDTEVCRRIERWGSKEVLSKRLELLEKLVKSVTVGKRISVCRFKSQESEYGVIGKNSRERYLVEKRAWVELNKEGILVIKYLIKWEHIGKLNLKGYGEGVYTPDLCRFIKSKE